MLGELNARDIYLRWIFVVFINYAQKIVRGHTIQESMHVV